MDIELNERDMDRVWALASMMWAANAAPESPFPEVLVQAALLYARTKSALETGIETEAPIIRLEGTPSRGYRLSIRGE